MDRAAQNIRSIRRRRAAAFAHCFETLERRALLSSANISYPDFSSIAGLTTNGFGSFAPTSNGQLVMTDSTQNEATSVFYDTPVPFYHFTTHFTYRADSGAQADGFTFALQENGPTALGDVGGSLGYVGMGGNKVAVGVSIFNGDYRVYSGNSEAYDSSDNINNPPLNVGNGDTYDFTITYDGTTLTTAIVDENNSANDYTNAYALDLNTALGANTAYVGFTAATGASVSTQRISDWDYSGTDGLTITTPAAANPTATRSTALSVAATDITNGGALTYDWSIVHQPSGAANPTFDDDNSTTADDTTANFFKAGTYVFKATATNANGLTDSSNVTVVVSQTATAVRVVPHAQKIARKSTQMNTATVTDQFGHPMRTQPDIVWSLLHGSGSINATTGVYTAGSIKGHTLIEATDTLDSLTGTIGATVD